MDKSVSISHFLVATGITVLTIALLYDGANVIAGEAFSDGDESTLPCLNVSDPIQAVTGRPNTVCRQKLPESSVIEYRFNACGHRTDAKCHRDGIVAGRRVVLLGSSLVEGYGVPVEASFVARLPDEIRRVSQQSIDVYNEAMQWGTPRSVLLRLNEVFQEKPTAVVWPISPFDIQNAAARLPYIPGLQLGDHGDAPASAAASSPAVPSTFVERVVAGFRKYGGAGFLTAGFDRCVEALRQTKAVFGAQHFMYRNQHEFVKHFLGNRTEANYLFAQPDPSIQAQLETFERYYTKVSESLRAAGIPLYVTMIPSHPQVSLLSGAAGDFPEADPWLLDRELEQIVRRHDDRYIDILARFKGLEDPADYFYAVDEHANERGHQLFAEAIAAQLARTPSFLASAAQPVASKP